MQSSNESEAGKSGNDLAGAVSVTVHTVLGVLLSIRHLMPLLDTTSDCSRRKITGVRANSAEPDVYVDLVLTVKVITYAIVPLLQLILLSFLHQVY